VSRLSAEFTLRDGTLSFSDLSFGVPGAIVQLAGTYNLKPETLGLRGNLLLDATLAETTNGWKAVVGRIAQPLFRRQGGGSKLTYSDFWAARKPDIWARSGSCDRSRLAGNDCSSRSFSAS
jgi:hypothetical protein